MRADASSDEGGGPMTVSVRSDRTGYFEIPQLPPGSYIVGVNLKDLPNEYNHFARVVYPGEGQEPAVVTLAFGQTVELAPWRLAAPLRTVAVKGSVVWEDGKPARGISVSASDMTNVMSSAGRGVGFTRTNDAGEFVLSLHEGRRYTIEVQRAVGAEQRPERRPMTLVVPRPDAPPLRIVMRGTAP